MEKKTILIIDDEDMVRSFLEHYFKKHFAVISKPDGATALEYLLNDNEVHAIVADLNMPIMNGLDFIKAVRNQKKMALLPIIVLSGNEKSNSKITALNLGADDYVVKPFNPEEILARLNSIFRRMAAHEALYTE
jgi:DNA-binding response OmpR family regulator